MPLVIAGDITLNSSVFRHEMTKNLHQTSSGGWSEIYYAYDTTNVLVTVTMVRDDLLQGGEMPTIVNSLFCHNSNALCWVLEYPNVDVNAKMLLVYDETALKVG